MPHSVFARRVHSLRFLLVLAVAQPLSAQTERVTLRGNDIALYNLVGRLRVTGGASGSATATVTRRGSDGSKLSIATGQVRGHESLRILYPSDQISAPDNNRRRFRTEVRVRDDGTFGDDNNNRGRIWREGRSVRITDGSNGLEAAADIELQVPNGVSLRVFLAVGTATVQSVNGDLRIDVSSGNVTVNDVKGSLLLDTGSGDVDITNVEGAMSFDTGSGEVRARNISGPSLVVDSGSGAVTIEGCTADKVNIDTGSGELRVNGLRMRTLSLDTGSGGVFLGLLSGFESMNIDSGSGDVTISAPASFAAALNIDTGSGGITSDFPIALRSKSRDQLVGTIGTGGGRVVIETGSGDVRIRKTGAVER